MCISIFIFAIGTDASEHKELGSEWNTQSFNSIKQNNIAHRHVKQNLGVRGGMMKKRTR